MDSSILGKLKELLDRKRFEDFLITSTDYIY